MKRLLIPGAVVVVALIVGIAIALASGGGGGNDKGATPSNAGGATVSAKQIDGSGTVLVDSAGEDCRQDQQHEERKRRQRDLVAAEAHPEELPRRPAEDLGRAEVSRPFAAELLLFPDAQGGHASSSRGCRCRRCPRRSVSRWSRWRAQRAR